MSRRKVYAWVGVLEMATVEEIKAAARRFARRQWGVAKAEAEFPAVEEALRRFWPPGTACVWGGKQPAVLAGYAASEAPADRPVKLPRRLIVTGVMAEPDGSRVWHSFPTAILLELDARGGWSAAAQSGDDWADLSRVAE